MAPPLPWIGLVTAMGPAFPAVDAHVHVATSELGRAEALFERVGVDWALNLSAGWPRPDGPSAFDARMAAAGRSGRVLMAVNLPWRLAPHPAFVEAAVHILELAAARGARALKIQKALGISVRGPGGARLAVDAPRLDPIWAAAGRLGLPVVIHTADPKAFWAPPTPDNERWAELSVHPGWSYHGDPEVPSFEALLAEQERIIARHPNTTFVSVHFGNHAEDPWAVARWLDRYPNLHVDIAARIVELGRHDPARLRALFARHAGRIVFGTDLGLWPDGGIMLGSTGRTPSEDADAPPYYAAHWRWLETDARLPSPVPIQGDWPIYGLDLDARTLRRVYRDNAEGLFGPPPAASAGAARFPPFFRGP